MDLVNLTWNCQGLPCSVPHVWHGMAPVDWEGPVEYRARVHAGPGAKWLNFWGVSCRCRVLVEGEEAGSHQGIWDAFSIDLRPWEGQEVEVVVEVIKNGGPSIPVKEAASGFLPYVYHTFGGIWREVELSDAPLSFPGAAQASRIAVTPEGRILADGKPFYGRGVLTWGWNPRTASCLYSDEEEDEMLDQIQALGFNLVKFCLWLPSHRMLKEMDRRGLWAWLELPIWLPSSRAEALDAMREECLVIARQYTHHTNVLAWTAGCELSEGIPPEWREGLVRDLKEVTRHPLVKDNSGGAEMYGGHPLEFGDFEDFHPYCDAPFYPSVLASLAPGPRPHRPTLLGEFNDYDVFRPLHRWADNPPYWASEDPALNAQGVRWQYDLPDILRRCRETDLGNWLAENEDRLAAASLSQGAWMRDRAFDATRLNDWIDGWVLTGWSHTPIASAGVVDDEGRPVYPPGVVEGWCSDERIILFPRRTPPWVAGGNRPGFESPTVRPPGPWLFQAAVHSVSGGEGALAWTIEGLGEGACPPSRVDPCRCRQAGRFVMDIPAGRWKLRLKWGGAEREFDLWAPESPLVVARVRGNLARPWFRECCWLWEEDLGWEGQWDALFLAAGDTVFSTEWLDERHPGWTPVLLRLDTRTFERSVAVARVEGRLIASFHPQSPRWLVEALAP